MAAAGQPGFGGNNPNAPPVHGDPTVAGAQAGGLQQGGGLPGPAPKTAGPHDKDILNKMNPTVDHKSAVPQGQTVGTTGTGAGAGTSAGAGIGATGAHGGVQQGAGLPGPAPTTAGPHDKDILNKMNPTVDHKSAVPQGQTVGTTGAGAGAGTGAGIGATGAHGGVQQGAGLPGPAPTTAGPHDKDILNKMNPTVDHKSAVPQGQATGVHQPTHEHAPAVAPGAAAAGAGVGVGAGVGAHEAHHGGHHHGGAHHGGAHHGGAHHSGHHAGAHHGGEHHAGAHHAGAHQAAPVGATTTTTTTTGAPGNDGPHSSHAANVLDPRVKSGNQTNTATGPVAGQGAPVAGGAPVAVGTAGTAGAGAQGGVPLHSSNVANAADPRSTTHPHDGAGVPATQGTNTNVTGGAAAGVDALPGPAPNTAGPHKKDILNKLDPRVDSKPGNTE